MKRERYDKMKKMTEKMLLGAVIVSILCGSITGCGGNSLSDSKTKSDYESTEAAYGAQTAGYGLQDNAVEEGVSSNMDTYEESAELAEEKAASDSTGAQSSAAKINDNQKIIKRYYYDYETETFDDAYSYLKELVNRYEGYISSSEIQGTVYRTLNLTARIPADSSDEFAGQLGSLGTVIRQSESAEDVTLQYTDTESRIASLKTEQERLNTLLEKADSLENIIALEERLTEVRYELENYESQKKLYDDLISYSTVNIVLEEVNYTVEVDDSSLLSRISTGLKTSLRNIRNGFTDFIVWLVVSLPYLVIWAVVILVIVKIIRRLIRRKRKKKELKEAAVHTADVEKPEEAAGTALLSQEQAKESTENGKK